MATAKDEDAPTAVETIRLRVQSAVKYKQVAIAERIRELHSDEFLSETDKSYVLPEYSANRVVIAVLRNPSALFLNYSYQKKEDRFVFESDFNDVIGITNEDPRQQSNRVQVTVVQRGKQKRFLALSLKILKENDPQTIRVICHFNS